MANISKGTKDKGLKPRQSQLDCWWYRNSWGEECTVSLEPLLRSSLINLYFSSLSKKPFNLFSHWKKTKKLNQTFSPSAADYQLVQRLPNNHSPPSEQHLKYINESPINKNISNWGWVSRSSSPYVHLATKRQSFLNAPMASLERLNFPSSAYLPSLRKVCCRFSTRFPHSEDTSLFSLSSSV